MLHSETLDFSLRALSVLLLGVRHIYWIVTERRSNLEKPLTKKPSTPQHLKRVMASFLAIIVFVQLLGFDILPFEQHPLIQSVGFLAVILGFAVCMRARVALGSNWAHGAEYQIKKNHELITSGVYKYIRHPIYAGFFLSLMGAEVVAGSFMFAIFLVILTFAALVQAKQEEAVLIKRFGQDYQEYMNRTTRFIPYVW